MTRSALITLIITLLAVIIGLTLLLNLPTAASTEYLPQAAVYAVLTTLTLYFGMLLTEGEFSATHVVGMTAFLSLPALAEPLLIWALCLGGLLGGIALIARREEGALRRLTARSAHSIVVITARVVLSFLIAGQAYTLAGGTLPLTTPVRDVFVALVIYSLVYALIYGAIFALEVYSEGRSPVEMLRANGLSVVLLLSVPIPFGLISALVINITPTSIAIYAIGAFLIALGLFLFSRTQYRLRKQLKELRSLAAVSQALQSDLKLSSLLYAVYNQVAQLLQVQHFQAALFDRDTHTLRFPLVIEAGQQLSDAQIKWDERTPLGHVLRRQQPQIIKRDANGKTRADISLPDETMQSWLGVPLLARGRLLGAVAVWTNDPERQFTQADLNLLNIVATSASVAIDNAQLYEHQTARANQLATLNRVLSLLNGTLKAEEVLDAVVSSATVVSDADAVAVYLYWDEMQSTFALVRSAGLSEAFTTDPPQPLLRDPRQKPVLVNNIALDTRAAPSRRLLQAEGKHAWAELALLAGDAGLGTIIFYFDEPQVFSEDDIQILRAFTNQAAQAIRNAQKYTTTDRALERRAEQMTALALLGRQLTATMNMRAICSLVLSRVLELTSANAGLVALVDETAKEWFVGAQSGYPPLMTLNDAALRQSLIGRVIASGQPLRTIDISREQPEPTILYSGRSHLSVPILRSGHAVGVITLESDQAAMFSEEDSTFVTQVANQTVIALDNTRLFERIAEARDRMQVILNTMTEGILLLDRSGSIALANPRMDLLGLQASQLLNQRLDALLERPELDLARRMGFQSSEQVRAMLKDLRAGWSGLAPVEYTVQGEQGMLHIQRDSIPVGGENGDPLGILLVFYDETEEKELAQIQDDLRSMIVHDLRSPLTAVTTGLKLLRDVVPQDNKLRPIIETTTETSQRAIRKLLQRVDSLLDISRMENGQVHLEIEPTELSGLVSNVFGELRPLAQELEVELISQVEGLPVLAIDPDKIERVLQNLVDNALKFSPMNSTITIRARRQPGDDPVRRVRVEVLDNGPGVPEDYKQRLFDRFVQVKGQRGGRRGTGLGLTFCRMVVESHGGTIWVEDNPTGGSIFAFTLPLADLMRFDETGE
jgi:signal transduction histidine kinase